MTGRDGDRERDRDGETEGETEAEGERERERQDIWRVSDRETVTYRDRTEGERERQGSEIRRVNNWGKIISSGFRDIKTLNQNTISVNKFNFQALKGNRENG